MDTAALTTDQILVPGQVLSAGHESGYRALAKGRGEPHGLRHDLCGPGARPAQAATLARLAHLTDLHIADTQSPLRLEFAMRTGERDPRWGGAVTYAFRPHELLTCHAVDAMVTTLSGLDLDLCVITGDNTDNTQANELAAYLAVLNGDTVRPVSAEGIYTGVQSPKWGDPWYWVPEVSGDRYQQLWGYPTLPGLLPAAATPFDARGLTAPWISCLGNHDVLVGGTTAVSPELERIAVSDHKATELEPVGDVETELAVYLSDPQRLFRGPGRRVPADAGRRLLRTPEIVAAHLEPGRGGPRGHGFTERNRSTGTAFYRYDAADGVCVFVLDTNHRQGMWDGSIDVEQLAWLEAELADLTGPDDPVAVIASHHATASLNNDYGVCSDTTAGIAYTKHLLHIALTCPNVVLWLNGHHHANRIVAHHRPAGGGFFEVTTASMVDWPTQARTIDIARTDDGNMIQLTSTIVEHGAPLNPPDHPRSPLELASLHRQVAANEVWRGGARQGLTGSPPDRNTIMLVPWH